MVFEKHIIRTTCFVYDCEIKYDFTWEVDWRVCTAMEQPMVLGYDGMWWNLNGRAAGAISVPARVVKVVLGAQDPRFGRTVAVT